MDEPARYGTGLVASTPYGQWIDGEPCGGGSPAFLVDPSTGQPFATWMPAGAAEVDRAMATARLSVDDGRWRSLPAPERAAVLEATAAHVRADAARLATLDALCTGKPLTGALAYDVHAAAAAFEEAAALLRGQAGRVHASRYPPGLLPDPAPRVLNLLTREPVGVVVELLPWNGPLYTGCERLALALAAGCSVVAKPAEESPLSLLDLAPALEAAGLPRGVLAVVLGGDTVGASLAADPRADLVSLTGGVETGRRVMAHAAANLTRVNLELGGKGAVVVFADADLDEAVSWASVAAFTNMGEICTAGARLLVKRPVYDEVVGRVAADAAGWPVGDALDAGTVVGPLVTTAHAGRVRGFVRRAERDGAHVVGRPAVPAGLPDSFVPPTVVGDVAASSELEQVEVFGPVLAAQPFDGEEEAVALANGTRYGLAATVFTGRLDRAFRIAERLDCGQVDLNCHFAPQPLACRGTPRRHSGVSAPGLDAYLASKTVNLRIG